MADRRIHIPKENEELVNRLCNAIDDEYNGPFKTKADVISFAAAYGHSHDKSIGLQETAKDPIRKSVFDSAGYGTLINLLAVAHTKNPNILALNDEMEDDRASIFEEYANGGLALLKSELLNASDYTSEINLIISKNKLNRLSPDHLDITSIF